MARITWIWIKTIYFTDIEYVCLHFVCKPGEGLHFADHFTGNLTAFASTYIGRVLYVHIKNKHDKHMKIFA